MSLLKSPITALHGVGAVRAESYRRLGICLAGDLLWHFPRSYENRGDIKTLAEATVGEKQALVLTVATKPTVARIKRGFSILKFRAFDATGTCEMTYFNQDYLKNTFEVGGEYRFYGKLEQKGGRFSMSSPAHEPMQTERPLAPLFPIYPSAEGLTQKQIKSGVHEVLSAAEEELCDYLPDDIRLGNRLPALMPALRGIHSPESYEELIAAKRRLIYDELFLFALALRLSAGRERKTGAPVFRDNDLSPFLSLLPYRLTGAQSRAVGEILSDMERDTPMNRILVGDVGCGKTVCAAAALYVAVKNGYQAALMVPTEILARQHAADLAPLLEKLGIRVTLLLGALAEKQKRLAREAIAARETDVVIGTQALISEGVEFSSLGLVVIDEQHRFGVNQRAWLSEKGKHVHTLVMSATPIPRTVRLAEAPSHGLPVTVYDRSSRGSVAYRAMAEEFKMNRKLSLVLMSVIMLVVCCMCSYSLIPMEGGNELVFFGVSLFDICDMFTSYIILPLGGLLIMLFLGWFYKKEDLHYVLVVETKCSEGLFKVYYFFLRFIAPLLLLAVFLQQLGAF